MPSGSSVSDATAALPSATCAFLTWKRQLPRHLVGRLVEAGEGAARVGRLEEGVGVPVVGAAAFGDAIEAAALLGVELAGEAHDQLRRALGERLRRREADVVFAAGHHARRLRPRRLPHLGAVDRQPGRVEPHERGRRIDAQVDRRPCPSRSAPTGRCGSRARSASGARWPAAAASAATVVGRRRDECTGDEREHRERGRVRAATLPREIARASANGCRRACLARRPCRRRRCGR